MKFIKEDPDQSYSPATLRRISYYAADAIAFGFVDLSNRRTLYSYGDEYDGSGGHEVGILEGFGPEQQNRIYVGEFGDTHYMILLNKVLPDIWKSPRGVIKIYRGKTDEDTGITNFNSNAPIVLDLNALTKEDKSDLFPTARELFVHVNARQLLFPAGRIWTESKVVSFWAEEGDVTPQQLYELFDAIKIPKNEIRNYYIEFLGDEKPHQTVADYINKSGGKKTYSAEEEEERKKRAAEAMAKMHVAGAVGTKDVDVQDLLAKRKKELAQADAEARRTGKIPDIKTKQMAMTSESLLSFKEFFNRK